MAIFASRLLHDRPPMIFEDGQQRRDFVSVHDVVCACRLALEVPLSGQHTLNIGSGESYAIQELAERLAQAMGKEHISPTMTGQYRMGDVRHCFADTSLAEKMLGFQPKIALQDGLLELVEWLEGQEADDRVEQASAELASKGLTI
jgi:dTDP-L-rhamnose 4-epimerase